jgi:hypothetical protein
MPGSFRRQGSGTAQQGATYQPANPLFFDPTLRQQLAITDDQFQRLNQAFNDLLNPARVTFGDPGTARQAATALELNGSISADLLRSAERILTPQQFSRFRQLELQRLGVSAFNSPLVQRTLQIDQGQLDQLQQIQQDYIQEVTALFPDLDANRNDAVGRFAELRTQFDQRIMNVLTPEQRQIWAGMIGEPVSTGEGVVRFQ